jgi:sterol desaturase/sphingolipid hydroxylase (fatty acid hydroxylase superfamily)
MGFSAHLRFHWMETIFYKSALYIPLTMIGFGIDDFFILHAFTTLIGHLNHANINLTYGPLKYILNNPAMHIWHHAKDMPADRPFGMNYGITLSVWDYIFGTAYIPSTGRDIELGFEDIENYPEDFGGQMLKPFKE